MGYDELQIYKPEGEFLLNSWDIFIGTSVNEDTCFSFSIVLCLWFYLNNWAVIDAYTMQG